MTNAKAKAPARNINAKPGKPSMAAAIKAQTKAPAKKETVVEKDAKAAVRFFLHYREGSTPYAGVKGEAFGALLPAAAVVTGFAGWDAKARKLVAAKGPGDARAFRVLVGARAWAEHAGQRRTIDADKGVMTSGGLDFMNARIYGEEGQQRKTNPDMVEGFITAMRKGGKAGPLNFERVYSA